MQIKIFNIPIGTEDSQLEELNLFLRSNKIIDVKREPATLDSRGCWSFCITYMLSTQPREYEKAKPGSGSKTDYKEILEPEAFARFSEFRRIRKTIAENEAIPAYAVFTDAELSDLAQLKELTTEAMLKIPGIGKKKVERYGTAFINIQPFSGNEAQGVSDATDSKS